MLHRTIVVLVVAWLNFNSCVYAKDAMRLINFERRSPGLYTKAMMQEDTEKRLQWFDSNSRLRIASESSKGKIGDGATNTFLRVTYPAGGVGPKHSGAQFKLKLAPAEEYVVEYKFRLQPGFDFRKGGKLPGICGGVCNTGKRKPDGNGWSLRYMWREEGRLFAYLYHLNQVNDHGDYLPLGVAVKPGRWYRISQRVKLNQPNQQNGELQIWLNGKALLARKDIAYRSSPKARIDTFYFSTFFGGTGKQWAPRVNSTADFDNFRFRLP